MTDAWVVYDDDGVIAQGPESWARDQFDAAREWTGDLVLAQIVVRKR